MTCSSKEFGSDSFLFGNHEGPHVFIWSDFEWLWCNCLLIEDAAWHHQLKSIVLHKMVGLTNLRIDKVVKMSSVVSISSRYNCLSQSTSLLANQRSLPQIFLTEARNLMKVRKAVNHLLFRRAMMIRRSGCNVWSSRLQSMRCCLSIADGSN